MPKLGHEEILIKGLKESNHEIFDYIFHLYYSGLVVFAQNIIHDRQAAEDIVQSFFIKLWVDRKKLPTIHSFKAYFFNSIKNRCIDYIKHNQVKDRVKAKLLSNIDVVSDADFLVESELQDQIKCALDKLPSTCREVFIQNRFEGLKPKEIAEKKGISIRTVEGHIGKALKLLKLELELYLPLLILVLMN